MTEINENIGIPLSECIESNTGLIWHIVNEFGKFDKDDLFQEASIAFMESYKKFDGKKGGNFIGYVSVAMRNRLINHTRRDVDLVKRPSITEKIIPKLIKMEDSTCSAKEIADKYGFNVDDVKVSIDIIDNKRINSMDGDIYNDDSKGYTMHRIIGSKDDLSNVIVDDFLERLSSVERFVIQSIMDGYTQREIADKIGRARSTIPHFKRRIINEWENFCKGSDY